MNKRIPPWLIFLILAIIVGATIRIWKIDTLPYPPNGDELAFSYYGWSLLHFGTDEYGNQIPVYFPSIGDYKYPTLVYLNMIPAALFGMTEFSARFWSIISGITLIPVMFILGVIIFDSIWIGLISGWLIALNPWSISLSRYGYETNVALTLTTTALILLLLLNSKNKDNIVKLFNKKIPLNTYYLILTTFILLILSAFCYGSQRIFIPLILLIFCIISFFKNSGFSKFKKPLILLFISLSVVIALSLIPWQSRGRASGVLWKNLTHEQENSLAEIAVEAGTSPVKVPIFITRLFHNKINIGLTDFLSRYIKHYESGFLFFNGEAAGERIPETGVLLLIQIIFLPLGLLFLFTNKSGENSFLILSWLLLAPIASAVTEGGPHLTRALIMLPPLILISGFGMAKILEFSKNKKINLALLAIFVSLLSVNALYVLNQLFVQKPVHQPWINEVAAKPMVNEVYKLKNNYKAVAIPDDDYIFFLFYQKIPPAQFLANSEIIPESREHQWERVKRLENIYFNMPFDCPKTGKLNVLYVCKGQNIPQNSKLIKVIKFPDGIPAFTLLEFLPLSKTSKILPELPENLHYMVDRETLRPEGIIRDSDPSLW